MFRSKIFVEGKYLVKHFHFTVLDCQHENTMKSFFNVYFTVKWIYFHSSQTHQMQAQLYKPPQPKTPHQKETQPPKQHQPFKNSHQNRHQPPNHPKKKPPTTKNPNQRPKKKPPKPRLENPKKKNPTNKEPNLKI